jgi:hypothetical protein
MNGQDRIQQEDPMTKKASKTRPSKPRSAKGETKVIRKTSARNELGKAVAGRNPTKKDVVLELLRWKEGASLAEITKATDWQNHTIRGFISGEVTKRMGLTVESTKNESGERVYSIAG